MERFLEIGQFWNLVELQTAGACIGNANVRAVMLFKCRAGILKAGFLVNANYAPTGKKPSQEKRQIYIMQTDWCIIDIK